MAVLNTERQSDVRQKRSDTVDFIQPKYKNCSDTFGTLSRVNDNR